MMEFINIHVSVYDQIWFSGAFLNPVVCRTEGFNQNILLCVLMKQEGISKLSKRKRGKPKRRNAIMY